MGCGVNATERAIHFAVTSHAGQTDKGGKPYILHVLRVGLAGRTPEEQITGFLHDIIEDTTFPVGLLAPEFGQQIADAVLSVSHAWVHKDGHLLFKRPFLQPALYKREDYMVGIERSAANPIGKRVKIYDLLDNYSPARLDQLPPRERLRLSMQYRVALNYLGVY